MDPTTVVRAAVYVDGCNLFHGMRTAKLRSMYWLDLLSLASGFLKQDQSLVRLVYFTARVVADHEKNLRHSIYIDALRARGGIEIMEGNYQLEPFRCRNCHHNRPVPKEKQTDTNIATEIVADAFLNIWDTAFLISGDSDLVPPIKRVKLAFPEKKILVAFPPMRSARELSSAAHGFFHINQAMLGRSQLPEKIEIERATLSRPDYWV